MSGWETGFLVVFLCGFAIFIAGLGGAQWVCRDKRPPSTHASEGSQTLID